jgi:hypothetical protein
MGVSGQRFDPAAFLSPEKEPPVRIRWEAVWVSEVVWTQCLEEKSFASTVDRTPVAQSVVRHYTVFNELRECFRL